MSRQPNKKASSEMEKIIHRKTLDQKVEEEPVDVQSESNHAED